MLALKKLNESEALSCGVVPCPRGGELEGLCFKLVLRDGNVEEVR